MNWDITPYTMLAIATVLEETKTTWYTTFNLWFWLIFIILGWCVPMYRKLTRR